MGSLTAMEPAGIMTERARLKVAAWSVPGWVASAAALRATWTLATVSGVGPNSFEIRRRTARPPRERWTMLRKAGPAGPRGFSVAGATTGAAAHDPVHTVCWAVAHSAAKVRKAAVARMRCDLFMCEIGRVHV